MTTRPLVHLTKDILVPLVIYETLFLDRDGTISYQDTGRYITKTEDFEFLPGALDAINILSGLFKRIVVVTNQRGIHTGELSEETLEEIHAYMVDTVAKYGGRIDKVYWCGGDYGSPCRKPHPQMAMQALKDFPDIDFSSSIMIGDSDDDVLFGSNLGMEVYKTSLNGKPNGLPYPSLLDVANHFSRFKEQFPWAKQA